MIYIGTCGYAYREWLGNFYPRRTRSSDMLPFYAERFRAVEIDSSYYGVPDPKTIASMEARTPPEFRFTVKAPASVTHAPDTSIRVHDDAARLVEALAPLRQAGKLECVLAQFPNGFDMTSSNEDYLQRVVEAFAGLPVVVEFRRRAWQSSRGLEVVREAGAGYCNVDMPSYDTLLRPSADATSAIGYVRMHGRNSRNWWKGTNLTRYDYDYSEEELVPWCDRIADLEAQTKTTLVFFNNHARGQATKNATMLERLLEGRYGSAAAKVIARPAHRAQDQAVLPGFG